MTEEQTNRNIKLCYFINAFKSSWFWLGIWIFYYCKFGGYKVVGIIEALSVLTLVVTQIPAGIIGDLIGKRKTLILGLIGAAIGNAGMGFASNLLYMILSASIYSIGESLIISNFQALIYDSLKNSIKD